MNLEICGVEASAFGERGYFGDCGALRVGMGGLKVSLQCSEYMRRIQETFNAPPQERTARSGGGGFSGFHLPVVNENPESKAAIPRL